MKFNDPFWDKFAELSLSSRALFKLLNRGQEPIMKRFKELPYIEAVYEERGEQIHSEKEDSNGTFGESETVVRR